MPQLLDAHIAHLRRVDSRPDTIKGRRNGCLRFANWLAPTELEDCTHRDVEAWLDQLTVSTSSKVTYLGHVRALYSWAHRFGHLADDPCSRVQGPRAKPGQPRPVPAKDFRIGLRTARGDVICMYVLAGYLGLRSGEIAAMRREDVIRDEDGSYLVVRGKGGRERTIPFPDVVLAAIAPWLVGRGPLLRTPTGLPARSQNVTDAVTAHFRALGMPYVCHQLRHRAATRLLTMTGDLRLVQQFLGHASPAQTAIYTQVADVRSREAVARLAAEFVGDSGQQPDPSDPGQGCAA